MKEWEAFLDKLEERFGRQKIDKWLRSLIVSHFDARNLYLLASDSFQVAWFDEHVRPLLPQFFLDANHRPIGVNLSLPTSFQADLHLGSTADPSVRASKELLNDAIEPYQSFDTFILEESNELIYKLLKKLCHSSIHLSEGNEPALGCFNPIYIYGQTGSGKSHLLMATCQELRKKGVKAHYVRAQTFSEHMLQAIRSSEMANFRAHYRTVEVLLIDDIHYFARKATTQEELFHTFNTLHTNNLQIILSANCAPNELQHIEPRLVSRFEWGITLLLSPLSNHRLPELLHSKAKAQQFPLTDRLEAFLLDHFKSGVHSLLRALQALVLRCHLYPNAYKGGSLRTLTPQQAYKMLNDLIKEEQQEVITLELVVKATASEFGITSQDILGKAQTRECSKARQIAAYLARTLLKVPFKQIGAYLKRHHSTVISSIDLVEKKISEGDSELISRIRSIERILKKESLTCIRAKKEDEVTALSAIFE